jgi:hypothetical protein
MRRGISIEPGIRVGDNASQNRKAGNRGARVRRTPAAFGEHAKQEQRTKVGQGTKGPMIQVTTAHKKMHVDSIPALDLALDIDNAMGG